MKATKALQNNFVKCENWQFISVAYGGLSGAVCHSGREAKTGVLQSSWSAEGAKRRY